MLMIIVVHRKITIMIVIIIMILMTINQTWEVMFWLNQLSRLRTNKYDAFLKSFIFKHEKIKKPVKNYILNLKLLNTPHPLISSNIFSIFLLFPNLPINFKQVGTLDQLVGLSDDLGKLDAYVETITRKVATYLGEVLEDQRDKLHENLLANNSEYKALVTSVLI